MTVSIRPRTAQPLRLIGVFAFAAVLAGCSTIDRINPFGRGDGIDPDAPPVDQRQDVLALEDQISVGDGVAPVSLPRAYVNDSWPQADGFAGHAMQHTQADGSLERVWRVDVGAGSNRNRRINARPVLLDGTIYTLDAQGQVTAVDAEGGERRWRARLRPEDREGRGEGGGLRLGVPFLGGGGSGGPDVMAFGGGIAVEENRVFVHSGGRFLVALDAGTGEEVWRAESFSPFQSAPAVAQGRVFATTQENELLALDASDGSVEWTHVGISETARLLTAPSPAVSGDVVIAPYSSGELVALRAQNGAVLWSDSLTRAGGLTPLSAINDISASPVATESNVYAMSHSGVLAAYDLRSGERAWEAPAGGLTAPWLAGRHLFVATTEGEVVAFDRESGEAAWITELGQFANERRRRDRIAWMGPILAGNRLVLASSRGEMVILDPADGSVQDRRDVGGDVFIAPIIANQTVYILDDDGRLSAWR